MPFFPGEKCILLILLILILLLLLLPLLLPLLLTIKMSRMLTNRVFFTTATTTTSEKDFEGVAQSRQTFFLSSTEIFLPSSFTLAHRDFPENKNTFYCVLLRPLCTVLCSSLLGLSLLFFSLSLSLFVSSS